MSLPGAVLLFLPTVHKKGGYGYEPTEKLVQGHFCVSLSAEAGWAGFCLLPFWLAFHFVLKPNISHGF